MFIALPAAAVEADAGGKLGLFMFTVWLMGIDSAVGFLESFVTNLVD